MNKKLLVSFALASLTGISTQAKEKMSSETTQQRPNSGHRKPTITKPMKPPIWNVWPKKG